MSELALGEDRITDEGATTLAASRALPALAELDLSGDSLTREGRLDLARLAAQSGCQIYSSR